MAKDSGMVSRVSETLEKKVKKIAEKSALGLQPYYEALIETEHILLSELLSEEEENQVVNSPKMAVALKTSQYLFSSFETLLEKSFASVFLKSRQGRELFLNNPDNITQVYLLRYRELARNEVNLGQIQSEDRVLFIGSGPFPISAIEMVRQTNCQVTCLECLEEASLISRDIVQHLGFEKYLKIFHANGTDVNCSDYNVILVGVLAQPKQALFDRIHNTSRKRAKILCRTTFGLRRFIYPPTDFDSIAGFSVKAFLKAKGNQTLSTVLLEKEDKNGNKK